MAPIAATTEEDIDPRCAFPSVSGAADEEYYFCYRSRYGNHRPVTRRHCNGHGKAAPLPAMISKYRPDVPIIGATTEEKGAAPAMAQLGRGAGTLRRQDNTRTLWLDHARWRWAVRPA